jgi:hypothetical protein
MAIQDKADARKANSLSNVLRRWRRLFSRAGIAATVFTFLVAAAAVFALCACKNMR